jgi:hypothetical protein
VDWHRSFFTDIFDDQTHKFQQCLFRGESTLGFSDFADLTVDAFNRISSVNDFSDAIVIFKKGR